MWTRLRAARPGGAFAPATAASHSDSVESGIRSGGTDGELTLFSESSEIYFVFSIIR